MKVKVCGITNIEDALMCESFGAEALGFIFYKNSKRYISPESALKIIDSLSPFTMKVGVFVNELPDEVNKIAKEIKLNAVQLHGDETPDDSTKINYPVIKSFRIFNGFDFSILKKFANAFYLLDSHSELEFGGTGNKFDWNLIPSELKNKIILAGGISSDNIEELYKKINPAAVDLSSSLENKPGKKDKDKVKRFFEKLNSLKANVC